MNKEHYEEEGVGQDEGGLAMPQSPQSGNGRAMYMLPASILVAAALISGTIFYAMRGNGGSNAGVQQANVGVVTGKADLMKIGGRDVIMGNQNAPVTLIEYGDYQCPFCARFFTDAEAQIRTNYIQTGKAKMVFRNLAFLGPESVAAAVAAECSKDQSQFWAYHDALYNAKIKDTQHGGGESDGFFTDKVFVQIATDLKMDVGAFTQCLSSKKYDTVIANDTSAAENAGVASTPTLYVNGTEIRGAQPYTMFAQAIDAALAKGK